MKAKLFYWIPTVLFSVMMFSAGVQYLIGAPPLVEAFHHLGYPDYFREVLGGAKVLGAVALVAPIWRGVQRLAYSGFAFNLAAAVVSHLAVGDPLGKTLMPAVIGGILAVSFVTWRRRGAVRDEARPVQLATA